MCNLVLCYLFCIDVVEELHRVAFRFVCLFICLFVCLDALASSLAPVDQWTKLHNLSECKGMFPWDWLQINGQDQLNPLFTQDHSAFTVQNVSKQIANWLCKKVGPVLDLFWSSSWKVPSHVRSQCSSVQYYTVKLHCYLFIYILAFCHFQENPGKFSLLFTTQNWQIYSWCGKSELHVL